MSSLIDLTKNRYSSKHENAEVSAAALVNNIKRAIRPLVARMVKEVEAEIDRELQKTNNPEIVYGVTERVLSDLKKIVDDQAQSLIY
jgi:F0F1-type ATP synthase membrane subunit b/b'